MPQLAINAVVLIGLLIYLLRALKRRRYRFVVVVLIVVVAVALWANLHNNVFEGPLQGGGSSKV